jgi:hypothetical protein
MPFFSKEPSQKILESGEITFGQFQAWKESQKLRNEEALRNQSGNIEVDLSTEPILVYFDLESIEAILKSKPDNFAIRFGCSDRTNKFKQLEVAIQGRDLGKETITTDTYIGQLTSTVKPTKVTIDNLDTWVSKEANFFTRNQIITSKQYSFQFKDERGGICHLGKTFSEWFPNTGLAVYILRDGEKTTVAFVDLSLVGAINSGQTNLRLFDFGNKCCP